MVNDGNYNDSFVRRSNFGYTRNDQPFRKPHDLERFQTDENISNLNFLGFTSDGEGLAGDAELLRRVPRFIRISLSQRATQEHVKRTQARLHFVCERHETSEERPLGLHRGFCNAARSNVGHVLVVAALDLVFEPSYAFFIVRPYSVR